MLRRRGSAMNNDHTVVNIVMAGLGGTGVIRASDMLAEAAFLAGYDIKKSEIHGMSQRGGSVSSDVRYGPKVYSPMVPAGEADFLMVLHPEEVETNAGRLREGGVLITPQVLLGDRTELKALDEDDGTPVNQRNYNVCMLGLLSTYLDIGEEYWRTAIFSNLPKKVHEQNQGVFEYGRTLREKMPK